MIIIIVVVSFKKRFTQNDKLHFVTGDGFFQIVTMPPAAAVCSFGVFFAFFGVLSTWLLLTQLSSKGGLNGLFSVFFFWLVVDLSWEVFQVTH